MSEDATQSPKAKGGIARAEKLPPERRKAIGRAGAEARWQRAAADGGLPRATHQGDREVGGLLIPVYNLADGSRVISERGFLGIIGAKGRGATGGHRISRILSDSLVRAFFPKDVLVAIEEPIRFLNLSNTVTFGYPSHVLKDFCVAFAKARDAKALNTDVQRRYAQNCQTLLYAFAQAGIDAWIDEATGYQADRARDAIDEIVRRYIAPAYFSWTKTFPDEFFEQIYKLKKWEYDPSSAARPGVVGRVIADVVYARLAPGVLDELERRNPKIAAGRRRKKHHQWLTRDHGHPKLKEHIGNVIFLMRGSTKWDGFYRALQRAAPRVNETPEFDFGED